MIQCVKQLDLQNLLKDLIWFCSRTGFLDRLGDGTSGQENGSNKAVLVDPMERFPFGPMKRFLSRLIKWF